MSKICVMVTFRFTINITVTLIYYLLTPNMSVILLSEGNYFTAFEGYGSNGA